MSHSNACVVVHVPPEACRIVFQDGKAEGVGVVKFDTARGETLMFEMNKEGEILAIDLVQPGVKPCQPAWDHGGDDDAGR